MHTDAEKPKILGYSLTDPSTDFTIPPHQIKNVSYYKRNWKSGAPLSSIPYWLDMDHIPPHKREFVLRPDLALGAMQAILGRIEKEELQELARRQALQDKRQEQLARTRQRHMLRHQAQQRIGAMGGPSHDFARASQARLAASRPDLMASAPSLASEPEASPADEMDAMESPSAESLPPSTPGLKLSASMQTLARLANTDRSISELKKPPTATMYDGMQGLCVPRFPIFAPPEERMASRSSLSPGTSTSSLGRSPSRGSARPASSPGVMSASRLSPSPSKTPVLGWTEPQGLLPRNRKSPTHFEHGLMRAPPQYARGSASPARIGAPESPMMRPASRSSVSRAARALS